jgi:Scavenger receptor cysteine-rich domain
VLQNVYYNSNANKSFLCTGNIEILHDGKWGAICDDEWDKNEATVVCRQLGFPGVVKATHAGYFGVAKRKCSPF